MTRRNHNGHSLTEVSVTCGECGSTAAMVDGTRIYPGRGDLSAKRFYLCSCGAYAGTHPGTCEPLGPPAGPVTRRARSRAHAHFDALHVEVGRRRPEGGSPRKRAYRWLTEKMGLEPGACHIGMMDAIQADRVTALCLPELQRLGVAPERR